MRTTLKIIRESILQALQQLRANKMRTFLSLLGVTIGIFSIIGVLSAVDSLEDNVRGSLEKLGNDIVHVKKWPWADISDSWWDYLKRPNPDYNDYLAIKEKVNNKSLVSYFAVIGFRTVKFNNASVENTMLFGCTPEFSEIFGIEYDEGRYFSPAEYGFGSNVIVIGWNVANQLFGENIDPIGKKVKLQGKKYEVIGVIEKAGDDLLNPVDFDDAIIVNYTNAKTLANLKAKYIFDTSVTVKAADNTELRDLKDEITMVLRAERRLKPKEKDNFSINELSMITMLFDSFFFVLNMLGILIGIFAMLVGGVSVANIMFVSVKERTSLIGIKKALGAKRFVILLEFLIESVILCIIGGLVGLLLIKIAMMILTNVIGFEMYIDFNNILLGLAVSIAIGVIAGFIPALRASKMDPVEAMRK